MNELEFVEFSKKKRNEFLDILSDLKEFNIEILARDEDLFYLKKVFTSYENFLHKLYDDYKKNNDINKNFLEVSCDFISTIQEQCEDSTYITRIERSQHIACVEYNIMVDIHKFCYELYSSNHNINEIDFFHGTCLTELLEKNETTIDQFRRESFYDIDNFNHITLPDDNEYLIQSNMIDIYLLNELSDIDSKEYYDDFFNLIYVFKHNNNLTKSEYRYFITMEDILKAKKSIARNLSYTLILCCVLLSIGIFFAYSIIK